MQKTQDGLNLDDKAMMGLDLEQAKTNWPVFPFLPLKRYRSLMDGPDCALFIHPATTPAMIHSMVAS